MHFVPTTPIKVKNATGAGDTHAGMCLKGLDLGWSIDKMLEEANKKAGEKMLENNK
jgi:sugar/nucleoside kinase (ribokinase family)